MKLDNKTNAPGSPLKGRVGPAFYHWLAPEIAWVVGEFDLVSPELMDHDA